jgi:predicted metal-dependent phosphoesterase TrpH
MQFDLHVHTTLSPCSHLQIDEILTHAKAFGLDGVCITDHETMEIRKHLREGIQQNGLCVIFGMEYSTSDGDFLLFGPFERIAPGLPAGQLLHMAAQSGGIAVAAHPFRQGRSVSEFVLRQGLCEVVESVNGRNSESENLRVSFWRKQYRFTECGGSDAHSLAELGKAKTEFSVPIRSRAELVAALRKGCCGLDLQMPERYLHRAANTVSASPSLR